VIVGQECKYPSIRVTTLESLETITVTVVLEDLNTGDAEKFELELTAGVPYTIETTWDELFLLEVYWFAGLDEDGLPVMLLVTDHIIDGVECYTPTAIEVTPEPPLPPVIGPPGPCSTDNPNGCKWIVLLPHVER